MIVKHTNCLKPRIESLHASTEFCSLPSYLCMDMPNLRAPQSPRFQTNLHNNKTPEHQNIRTSAARHLLRGIVVVPATAQPVERHEAHEHGATMARANRRPIQSPTSHLRQLPNMPRLPTTNTPLSVGVIVVLTSRACPIPSPKALASPLAARLAPTSELATLKLRHRRGCRQRRW